MPGLIEQFDLAVVGGGPAGTAAAITAAQAGARVLLLERGRFPRHKVCGEFVSAEALDLLGQLLGPAHPLMKGAARIPEARIFLDARILRTPIAPAAASIARFDLDAALWESALQTGVEAWDQSSAQQIAGNGPFTVIGSFGEVKTRALMNATGRWSNLSTGSASNGAAGKKWLGLKAHFAEPSPPPSVDLYFFEGGYCGVSAVGLTGDDKTAGRLNACVMVRADVASTLQQAFSQTPALWKRSRNWQQITEVVSTSPLIFGDPQPVDKNVFRIGDAAGFVDPFVGDGISLALRSGALAAEALIPFFRGQSTLERAAEAYSRGYEQQLAGVFRNSSRIRQALRLPKALRTPALFVMQKIPALTQHLVSMTR